MDYDDIENATNKCISCTNVPTELLDKTGAKKYFSQFGRITKITLRPKSKSCSVEYEEHKSAEYAITQAGEYKGDFFNITWDTRALTKKKRVKKEPDPEWMDPDVKAELEAMGQDFGVKRKYNLRPESMSIDDNFIKKERKTKRTWKASEIATQKPIKVTNVSTPNITNAMLIDQNEHLNLIKQPALNIEDKFKILDARDKLIRLRNKMKHVDVTKGIIHNVGTCPDMCPEKERLMREVQHQVALYEQEVGGRSLNPHIAVKQYSRSSADQESPLAHDLRNVDVLEMTMGYLMHRIMNLCDSPDVNLGDWFHFLWDRTRGIRKDITQQELCCQGSVELVEQCARFHIHCSARLVAEDPSVFDQKINTENLTKCLQTLKYMYHDLEIKGENCPQEAEFRAYVILLNLNDGNFLWEVQQLRPEIQKSQAIKFALDVYSALDKNNYVKFFKLVISTTYLNACILLRYFIQVRTRALRTIIKCYAPRAPHTHFPIKELQHILAFENAASTIDFVEYYGLSINPERTHVILDKRHFSLPDIPYALDRAMDCIESKKNCSIGQVVYGRELPPPIFENHVPHDSFDANGFLKLYEFLNEAEINDLPLKVFKERSNSPLNCLDTKRLKSIYKLDNRHEFASTQSPDEEIIKFGEIPKTYASENVFKTNFGAQSNFVDSIFGSNSASASIFGPNNANESVFGPNKANESVFSPNKANESVFALNNANELDFGSNNANKSVFSSNNAIEPIFGSNYANESDFGPNSASKSIFGSNNANESVFGPNNANESDFGLNYANKSDFGSNNAIEPIFGPNNANESVFGPNNASESIFASNNAIESVFASNNANKSVFASNNATELIFGSNNASQSCFGATNKSIFAKAENIFGQTQSNIFGGVQIASKHMIKPPQIASNNVIKPQKKGGFVFDLPPNRIENVIEDEDKCVEELEEELKRKNEEYDQICEDEERAIMEENTRQLMEEERLSKLKDQIEEEKLRELICVEEAKLKQIEEEKLRKLKQIKEEADFERKLEDERLKKLALAEKMRKLREKEEEIKQIEENARSAEIKHSVKIIIDKMLQLVEANHKNARLNEIKSNFLKRRVITKWRKRVTTNKRKRKAIDQSPLWISHKSSKDEATNLYKKNQDLALNLRKRYKSGLPMDLQPKPLKIIKKANLDAIVGAALKQKYAKCAPRAQNDIYWKCNIQVAQLNELETKAQVEYALQTFFDWKPHNQRICLLEQTRNCTICIEKIENTQKMDANGCIYIADQFTPKLYESIRNCVENWGKNVQIPIVLILQNCNASQMRELSTDYKIIIGQFAPNKLIGLVEEALKFVATHVQTPPELELNTLKAFLMQFLGGELWKRIGSYAKWNLAYKKCLTKPNLVINLHNDALERIKNIIFDPNCYEFANFDNIFQDFLRNKFPDYLPCDYKHFPGFWQDPQYRLYVFKALDAMKLPPFEATWPPNNQIELEKNVLDYIKCVFAQPEPIFYKVMATILRNFDAQNDSANILWNQIIEVIALEQIESKNYDLLATHTAQTIFNQLFVIYESKKLHQFSSNAWFYLTHDKIQQEINLNAHFEETKRKTHQTNQHFQHLYNDLCLEDDIYLHGFDQTMHNLCKDEVKIETIRAHKSQMDDMQMLLADLKESLAIQKEISHKFQDALKGVLEDN